MQLQYSRLERELLNNFQRDFPLCERPYAKLAEQLGVSEARVIATLQVLNEMRVVSRVGPVFRVNSIGCSSLAAMSVPGELLQTVADIVSSYSEVNHNYEREHHFNLWFVLTAEDEARLQEVLDEIEQRTGFAVLYLPMLEDYHIDLGFDLEWT